MKPRDTQNRRGASLLEVLIATCILLVAVTALSTRAQVGVRAATRAQLQALACAICQSVLDEQVALRVVTTTSARPVAGFRDWMYRTHLEPLDDLSSSLDLRLANGRFARYSVTVWQLGRNELASRLTLTQLVRSVPEPQSDIGEPTRVP